MRRAAAAIAVAAMLLGSGCTALRWPFSRADGLASGYTQEELAAELAAYATRFGSVVNDTAEEIEDRSQQRGVRRRALVWRLQMPPLIEDVAYGDSPQRGYLATVLVAVAQQRYLAEGDGRALFEEFQPLAVDAAVALVEDILVIGDRFLTKRQLAEVREKTGDLAERYPIVGRDFSVQRIPRAVVRAELSTSLAWLIKLPLSPFTALQGVDSGAAAIREFNQTAREFAQIAKVLPERLRGQLDLFVYDLEDRETVEKSVDAIDRAASSAERAAAVVERLPAELRRMLVESQGSVDAVGRVVEQSQALAAPLAATAGELEQASAHWLAILGAKDASAPMPDARPFDVRDWQATAQSIGAAAGELRTLAVEIQTLGGWAGLDASVDRAFWRGVALIGVFFVALLGYRLVAARLARQ